MPGEPGSDGSNRVSTAYAQIVVAPTATPATMGRPPQTDETATKQATADVTISQRCTSVVVADGSIDQTCEQADHSASPANPAMHQRAGVAIAGRLRQRTIAVTVTNPIVARSQAVRSFPPDAAHRAITANAGTAAGTITSVEACSRTAAIMLLGFDAPGGGVYRR